jgi:hypothetical protein
MEYDAEGGPDDEREDEDNEDIQALLELGYEQLDGFRNWVDDRLEMGARIAEQDCFNAEFLIDYLANHQRKGVSDINEFELRWFMFSHYIRKAMADEETETRLPESLQRFFGYLRRAHRELAPAWVGSVLDDVGFFIKRRQEYAALNDVDERAWEMGFREWCAELEDDLDTRCLWLPRDIGDGMEWSDVMGWRESTLHAQATEAWQQERDQLLRQGLDYEAARTRLMDIYYGWLDTPQARLDEQTPLEVIQAERLDRAEEPEDDGLPDDMRG